MCSNHLLEIVLVIIYYYLTHLCYYYRYRYDSAISYISQYLMRALFRPHYNKALLIFLNMPLRFDRWLLPHVSKTNLNNYSSINVSVDCIPRIRIMYFPIDSFNTLMLSSDNFTTISYGPSTLFTSTTDGNMFN